MGKPLKVGIIGCGAIIAQYLANFRKLGQIDLVAVADLDPARAQAVADGYEGVRALSVEFRVFCVFETRCDALWVRAGNCG